MTRKPQADVVAELCAINPRGVADYDCCDFHERTYLKGGACPLCELEEATQ